MSAPTWANWHIADCPINKLMRMDQHPEGFRLSRTPRHQPPKTQAVILINSESFALFSLKAWEWVYRQCLFLAVKTVGTWQSSQPLKLRRWGGGAEGVGGGGRSSGLHPPSSRGKNSTWKCLGSHWDMGSIPSQAQWVRDQALPQLQLRWDYDSNLIPGPGAPHRPPKMTKKKKKRTQTPELYPFHHHSQNTSCGPGAGLRSATTFQKTTQNN